MAYSEQRDYGKCVVPQFLLCLPLNLFLHLLVWSDPERKLSVYIYLVLLPRPAYKHKQIGLLVRPRKITSGYGRKWQSPFSTLTSRYSCREEENLVFCFGAQFNSTLNFTQSGWLIQFSSDLHFRLAKRVSGQIQSLRLETATRTDVPLFVPA